MKRNSGFTLIEILIVIGVLGILAAGMLAAVDPFEQLKKGRDTNRRNVVVELHNSNIRYYATHGDLPWEAGACGSLPDFGSGAISLSELDGTNDCIQPIIDDGELKEDFIAAVGNDADDIYVYSPNDVSLRVCFSPESKAQYADEATKYDQTGEIAANCATGGTFKDDGPGDADGLCYWCAK